MQRAAIRWISQSYIKSASAGLTSFCNIYPRIDVRYGRYSLSLSMP
jgi:hypothetical protein